MTEPGGRLTVPRLTSRSGNRWVVATFVALAAVCMVAYVAQPGNRWAVLVVAALAVLLLAVVLVRRTWVDTSTGTVGVRTLLGTRTVALADAVRLELVNNRGGGLLLAVRRQDGRRSLHLPVLALSDYVKRSQSPQTLRALAEQIDSWAPARGSVARQLRRQAAHLEAGGSAEESPLAALVTRGVTSAAKGGGAAGGSSLLD